MSTWGEAQRSDVARAVAAACLSGDWEGAGMTARTTAMLGRRPRWLTSVVGELLATYRDRPSDRSREVAATIERMLHELEAAGRLPRPPRQVPAGLFTPAMGRMRWAVPAIETPADLAALLDLHPGELDWLGDRRGLQRRTAEQRLQNYRYRWLPRAGSPPRLIEQPKRLLKETQRRLLRQILEPIPPHDAAHGFRRGHSALTHARRHTGRDVVLRFDLEDFFASIAGGRVYGMFRTAGYPEAVAVALTGLVTNVLPAAEWARAPGRGDPTAIAAHHRLGRRLATPHLPQGGPTSPALANLCAYRLDCRLAGLADATGAVYSRYADDIALSGGRRLHASAARVRRAVEAIARDEGFRVNPSKSQLMPRAGRQRICGIVVNEHPNTTRTDYDRLRALLHDAALHGPAAANRAAVPDLRAHILGRISWMEALNPRRGARQPRVFARIDWSG
ncbi:MAG: reverse transcriptase family protein [Gaiellales bacterium]